MGSNLILTKAGPRPFDWGKGGEASSLERRAEDDHDADQRAGRKSGIDRAGAVQVDRVEPILCCTRLGKLADMGLTSGPKCDARARWDLTPSRTRRSSRRGPSGPP